MAAAKIKIELENGKTYNLSESVSFGDESHSKNYGLLEEALNHLQKQTNSILTDVVEEEKSKLNSDSKNSTLQGDTNSDDEEEDDDDSDTTDEPNGKPPEKKIKT